MDSKDIAVLEKMLRHTGAILDYCADCSSLDDFQENPMRVEATVFNLMQLGELAKQSLSDAAKAQIDTIPWQQLYGLRNRIVHGYAGVNMRIVWDTVADDIPELHRELKRIVIQS
jgi:hypothetical protein